jgi:hypothetical protein
VSWNFSEMMTMTTQSVHAHHSTSLSSYTTTEIAVVFAVVAVTVLLFLSAVHIVLCAVFHTSCTALENDSAYTTHPASSSQQPPPPSPGSPAQDPPPLERQQCEPILTVPNIPLAPPFSIHLPSAPFKANCRQCFCNSIQ